MGAAFRATPAKRINGFAGYRFKRDLDQAFLHVFMGSEDSPWSDMDAECIEAEVVYRIRQHGEWPRYQTEIHFSAPQSVHSSAADSIMNYFIGTKAGTPLIAPKIS
ncbi:hypothetical protein [Actomonas aquatica]|uniref:KTSC domain-containing protein n=1 Tax=Actomonas aquatica TaxID=2866162 RepID=A0ABZ1C8N7_9BACT|nr:hypothetical protein [Opitutus sp. WL0086]WRQ88061.1 hypothetical protein K1X11_001495 [Opitutus sp. WL0086]